MCCGASGGIGNAFSTVLLYPADLSTTDACSKLAESDTIGSVGRKYRRWFGCTDKGMGQAEKTTA